MSNFYPADVGRTISASGGLATITGYTDADNVDLDITTAFPATSFGTGGWTILGSPMTTCTPSAATPVGATITLTLGAAGWRDGDVGKYVRLNGGLCKILAKTSDTIASARIVTELNSAVAAEQLAWSLEGSMWGGIYGYPRCGGLYEQRLWLAGSSGFPQMIWGSCIGVLFDFTLGVLDDDALAYSLGSEYAPILHLETTRGLIVLTSDGEYSVRGGGDQAITPTNIKVLDQSAHGASDVQPQRIGLEVYFVQRAGKKLRAMSLNQYQSDQYVSPDMTTIAEHITGEGIVSMAYQQEPDNLLHAVRADGQMATLTASREQDVFAWTRQVTQGAIESVASVPTAAGDALFAVVARVVEGATTRYIEMLDPDLNTDSALTGTSEAGAATWTGFDHLEGRTVQVIADGLYQGDFTVEGGGFTLTRDAFEIEAGLQYISTIKMLTPEVSAPVSSLAGAQLSVHEVKVRFHDSLGCRVNLQEVAFRQFGADVLDQRPPLFSGDKKAGNLGWADGEASTLIQQVQPYPFHPLAVITRLTANEG